MHTYKASGYLQQFTKLSQDALHVAFQQWKELNFTYNKSVLLRCTNVEIKTTSYIPVLLFCCQVKFHISPAPPQCYSLKMQCFVRMFHQIPNTEKSVENMIPNIYTKYLRSGIQTTVLRFKFSLSCMFLVKNMNTTSTGKGILTYSVKPWVLY